MSRTREEWERIVRYGSIDKILDDFMAALAAARSEAVEASEKAAVDAMHLWEEEDIQVVRDAIRSLLLPANRECRHENQMACFSQDGKETRVCHHCNQIVEPNFPAQGKPAKEGCGPETKGETE